MNLYYKLNGREIVQCADVLEWGRYFDAVERKIGHDTIGDVVVSTVFLGIDHSFGQGPPLLFETMVFGGKLDEQQERYSTYEQAERGHADMVAKVKESQV